MHGQPDHGMPVQKSIVPARLEAAVDVTRPGRNLRDGELGNADLGRGAQLAACVGEHEAVIYAPLGGKLLMPRLNQHLQVQRRQRRQRERVSQVIGCRLLKLGNGADERLRRFIVTYPAAWVAGDNPCSGRARGPAASGLRHNVHHNADPAAAPLPI